MTTNAIDKRRKVLATDSRWSIKLDDTYLLFVDDTGFDKMADRFMGTIICAGDGELIEKWRDWFLEPVLDIANLPPVDRVDANGNYQAITISLISKPDCKVLYSFGWYLEFEEEAKFSGSGAVIARECFSKNRCGKQAVITASQADPMTGGETKFVDVDTLDTNLSPTRASLKDAEAQLRARGMVMNMKTRKVEPINPHSPGAIAQALSADAIGLSAPTGHPDRPWTESEKEDLRTALGRLAELERAANQ